MKSSKHSCEKCDKTLSSYKSLWRHKQTCRRTHNNISPTRERSPVRDSSLQDQSPPMLTTHQQQPASMFHKRTRNPRIEALLHEIINGSTAPSEDKASTTVLPPPPPEVVADLFRKEAPSDDPTTTTITTYTPLVPVKPMEKPFITSLQELCPITIDEVKQQQLPKPPPPPPELVIDVFRKPRTKGEIIGYSDDDDDDDDDADEREEKEDEDGEEDGSEDSDGHESRGNVKFLPATVEGLLERFNTLFKQFTREGKQREQRNELVFILDELLRQEGISRDEYTQLNNMLAQSLDNEYGEGMNGDEEEKMEEEESPEPNLKKLIETTVDYLLQDDKKELVGLIKQFKNDDKDFIDTVLELEELIDVYLLDDIVDNEPVIEKLDEVREKLEKESAIPKSKLQRLKILLHDIDRNRHRVRSILNRLLNANGQEQHVLQQLALEELLSEEQRLALEDARLSNELVPTRIVAVIKGTKIGQGLKFLPCKVNDLVKRLQTSLEELAARDQSDIRKRVCAVLEELLKRKGITLERYTAIKRDNNIL